MRSFDKATECAVVNILYNSYVEVKWQRVIGPC